MNVNMSEQNCSQDLNQGVLAGERIYDRERVTALVNNITANLWLLTKIRALPQDLFDCQQINGSIIRQWSKLSAAFGIGGLAYSRIGRRRSRNSRYEVPSD